MPGFAFAIPVLPGKEELDRNTMDEMLGSRRDEYEAALAKFGSFDAPLNTWFRDEMKEVHGVDVSEVELSAAKVHDIQL